MKAPLMNTLRPELPPLPARLARLPIDERGYPVPYFVEWIDGKPDHRVMAADKMPRALKLGLCWMCGEPLGAFKAFCIGPMCAITRSISEPPSHLECLHYAVRACPWMTRPHAKRRGAGLPEDARDGAGLPIKRNPGVVCLWVTRAFRPYRTDQGNTGMLFELGEPVATEWWREGRPATRAEVEESVASGLPLLEELARAEDAQRPGTWAMGDLDRRCSGLRSLLDRAFSSGVAS